MEKYSAFTDQKTGSNPFLPEWGALKGTPSPLFIWIFNLLITKPILILLRLPVLLISLLLLVVTEVLTFPLTIHPATLRKARLLLQRPAWRLLLATFGLTKITMEFADSRRLRVQSDRRSELKAFCAEPGCEILFANFTGPAEVIFLHSICRPRYVIPDCTENAGGQSYYLLTFWQMLERSLSHISHLPPPHNVRKFDSLVAIHDFCMKHGAKTPIVIFPEAAKSNGTAILQWKIFEKMTGEGSQKLACLMKEHARVIGFQYDGAYTPVHTVYSGWYHLFLLMQSTRCSMILRWTSRSQMLNILNYLPTPDVSKGVKSPPAGAYFEALRTAQARMLPGVVLSHLDGSRSSDFAEYFVQTQNMKYVKKMK